MRARNRPRNIHPVSHYSPVEAYEETGLPHKERVMIRKTIISGVLAAGAFAGMMFDPSSAEAAPPAVGPAYGQAYGPNTGPFPPRGHDWHNRAKFQVVVLHRGHWDVVETFRDRDDAQRLAWRLERQGQNAEVRRVG